MANASLGVIYDQDLILLQKRDGNARKNPNMWGCFGGSLHEREDPFQALKRELFQELQYRVQNPELIVTIMLAGDGKKYFFMEPYDCNQNIILGEGAGLRWFRWSEIEKLPIVPHHQMALHFFINNKKLAG